jgi:hypothetical protein
MLSALKTSGWFSTISFVGPRATEKLSTGMMNPREGLEEAEEPPPDRRDCRDLHEVRGDVEIGPLEHDRERDEGHRREGEVSGRPPAQRQREPDQRERQRHEAEREEGDVAPLRETGEVAREPVVEG